MLKGNPNKKDTGAFREKQSSSTASTAPITAGSDENERARRLLNTDTGPFRPFGSIIV